MKRTFLILALAIASVFAFEANAQVNQQDHRQGHWCASEFSGTDLAYLDEFVDFYYRRGGKQQYQTNGRALKYVPIKYHLVANSDGSGRYPVIRAIDDLCKLNQDMSHADIQFYLKGTVSTSINNTAWHTGTGGSSTSNPPQYSLMPALNNDANALNIYQVQKIRNDAGVLGVAVGAQAAFHNQGQPNPNSSMILIKKGNGGLDQTLAHECGHNFSLPHTFLGWEGQADYVCGVAANGSAEKYSGSNCLTTGDHFCDTPPDYIAGGFQCTGGNNSSTCLQMDADSATGNANGSNIMSYGFGCSNRAFSQDQINAMDYQLTNFRSSMISTTPTTTAVTAQATLNTPNATIYDNVVFTWSAVPNATHYAIEINWSPGFNETLMKDMAIVQGTTFTSTKLTANRVHYWRVLAFNEGYFCGSPTSPANFTTGSVATGVRTIDGVEEVSIQPNITSSGRSVNLVVNSSKSFDADINIYNMQGQVVMTKTGEEFPNGTTVRTIETSNFSAGVYIVAIQSDNRVVNKKLVITD